MPTPPSVELRGILLNHLADVTFDISSSFELTGDVDQVGIVEHRLEIIAHAFETDPEGAAWLCEPGVTLENPVEDGGDTRAVIGTSAALTIDLLRAGHLGELVDLHSGWAERFRPLEKHGVPNRGLLGPNWNPKGTRLLLVDSDSTKLAPAWRFLGGVGRLLLARALREFTADCATVAIRPAAHTDDWVGHIPAIANDDDAVRHLARSVGFNPVGDTEILAMDPARSRLDLCIDELERRRLHTSGRTTRERPHRTGNDHGRRGLARRAGLGEAGRRARRQARHHQASARGRPGDDRTVAGRSRPP